MLSVSHSELSIGEMTGADVDAVAAIELASNPNPWPADAFARELRLPFSTTYLVRGTQAPYIRGFIVVWSIRGEVHILNFAVHPDTRRQGVGRMLLEHVLETIRSEDAHQIYLEVRRSNQPAQMLYALFGFEQIGVRERYYNDNDEDALVMARRL